MKITIEGSVGEGKTLIATMIEKFLLKSGLNPVYEDDFKNKKDIIYVDIGDNPVKFILDAKRLIDD